MNERVEVCTELEIDDGLGLLSNHKAVLKHIPLLYSSISLLCTVLCIVIQGKYKALFIAQKVAGSLMNYEKKVQNAEGKAIQLHAWTGPESSSRLRLPDFKTIST